MKNPCQTQLRGERDEMDISKLEQFLGQESSRISALDKVSKSDIRHWCEVMDEDNTPFLEINWDEKLAPPAMMMVWAMPPLWSPESKTPLEPHEVVLNAMNEAGYDGAVGLAMEQEFRIPIRLNDCLTYTIKVEKISPAEIETGVGTGYLVDLLYTFSNQEGEVVGTNRYRLLKYQQLNPAV